MAGPLETTPLIRKDSESSPPEPRKPWLSPIHFILLCGFVVSTSFGVTQIPLLYVFRVMTCEAYYDKHPKPVHGIDDDICAVPEIEAGTARAVSLLGFSTVTFGILNVFLTGWGIKRFGVKAALALQVFWPAGRLVVQTIGVMTGGARGIILVQASQIITIVGGPQGYLLALNTYVTELTEHKERTGALGRLQGFNMFGAAIGSLAGGILAEEFRMVTPFQVTFALFILSTIFVLLFLPYVPITRVKDGSRPTGLSRMFGPLKTLIPSKYLLSNGTTTTSYGALILACGVFLGVLATGYINTLLQLYATDLFGFRTKSNSYLIFLHTFLRGAFLTFAFPRIITLGRQWLQHIDHPTTKHVSSTTGIGSTTTSSGTTTPRTTAMITTAIENDESEQSALLVPTKSNVSTASSADAPTFAFDLIYTRVSLLVDGLLTLSACLVTSGYQMYIVAAILPLGAGSSSAAKGTILQMIPSASRTDALSAIAFVEMIARLGTTFVFGLVFAAFASIGKLWMVFICNAAVALVGFGVLCLARFPEKGAVRLVDERKDTRDEER